MTFLALSAPDPRVTKAHTAHAALVKAQATVLAQTKIRDAAVKSLRKSDPKLWTHARLALAVGCSKTVIKGILAK